MIEYTKKFTANLRKSSPFRFNNESLTLLKNDLKSHLVIPNEIEEFLSQYGGLFFKSKTYLIFDDDEFEILYVMGNSLESVQINLIKYIRSNPSIEELPVLKLNHGFVCVRLTPGNKFGNICLSQWADEDRDFHKLNDLFDHISTESSQTKLDA